MSYMDQVTLQLENNTRALYDISQVLHDYIEYSNDAKPFSEYSHRKHTLGSSIETKSKIAQFCNSFKISYLQGKKKLASYYKSVVN